MRFRARTGFCRHCVFGFGCVVVAHGYPSYLSLRSFSRCNSLFFISGAYPMPPLTPTNLIISVGSCDPCSLKPDFQILVGIWSLAIAARTRRSEDNSPILQIQTPPPSKKMTARHLSCSADHNFRLSWGRQELHADSLISLAPLMPRGISLFWPYRHQAVGPPAVTVSSRHQLKY